MTYLKNGFISRQSEHRDGGSRVQNGATSTSGGIDIESGRIDAEINTTHTDAHHLYIIVSRVHSVSDDGSVLNSSNCVHVAKQKCTGGGGGGIQADQAVGESVRECGGGAQLRD